MTAAMRAAFAAPPPQTRPRLPLSVKADLVSQIDWRFTMIAAFSFLFHFGVVGALYSDWTDPVIDDGVTAGLLSMVQRTAPDPAPPDVGEAPEEQATSTQAAAVEPAPAVHPEIHAASPRSRTTDPGAMHDSLDTVERTRVGILLSLDPGRALTAASSGESDGAPLDLNRLAQQSDGVDNIHLGGLNLPAGSDPLATRGGLRDLRPTLDPPAVATAGPARVIVPFDIQYSRPTISGPMPNAEATIRTQIDPGARRCYEKGLESEPGQAGRLVLQLRVAPSGEVDAANATTNTGLSARVVECIARVARRARFDAPGPGGAMLSIPFTFVRQGG